MVNHITEPALLEHLSLGTFRRQHLAELVVFCATNRNFPLIIGKRVSWVWSRADSHRNVDVHPSHLIITVWSFIQLSLVGISNYTVNGPSLPQHHR